jgi:hypothetical protein
MGRTFGARASSLEAMVGRLAARRRGRAHVLAWVLAVSVRAGLFAIPVASALAPTALLPPQLQALEQKMEQLQINSERFSTISQGRLTLTDEANGRPVGRSRHVSLNSSELGEASLSPAEGEVFVGSKRRPARIAIGSTVYQYEAPGKRSRNRRPWVRSKSPHESPATQILPFIGGDRLEVEAGGKGSFARLINLLTTVVGTVSVDGRVLVRGQQTTEFTVRVEPRFLIKRLTVEDVARFKAEAPIQQLQIFVTETGLPIRVVTRTQTHSISETATTEILAVNVPVTVKPPPTSETRQSPSKK